MNLETLLPLLAVVLAYLLGSIPFGALMARLFEARDLEHCGGFGTSNIVRTLGLWPAGVLMIILSVFKGALAVAIVQSYGVGLWSRAFGLEGYQFSDYVIWLAGLGAILGSCYAPWRRFRGSRGLTTGLGVLILLSPWAALAAVGAFGLAFLTRRDEAAAALAGLVVAVALHLVINPVGTHHFAGAVMLYVILLRYEGNIDALLERPKSDC